MQIIATSPGNVVIYKFQDDVEVMIGSGSTVVSPPVDMEILDVNSSNAVLYKGVTLPEDFGNHKFLYDGTSWSINPDPMVHHPDPQNWYNYSLVDGVWQENNKYLQTEAGDYVFNVDEYGEDLRLVAAPQPRP